MSMITLSSLQRITAPKLADMLLANANQLSSDSSVAIVDVRDDDHIGGHIKSSLHFPSRSLDAMMPTLVRKLADKDVVVFHCALSQQRGPSAALQYLRAKEGASAAVARKVADEQQSASGEGEAATKKQQQTVYILDRGFVGWQEAYGPDERLTEAYRKEIWEDGY
ncbi:Rhodanese-like protein [Hypoxylon rubiginosum]|uniref:Rhodanese-like protein n=1 Tax=Hypoxylon rubiginosum TaxID=110542 RepID=A0ACC0CZ25_9PEZI|nr:Rhodanese-like protein [Hypoxylon rubiginosum]